MIRAGLRAKLYLPHPEKGERIEMVLRRHTLVMFFEIVFFGILLVVPWVLRWFLSEHFVTLWNSPFWHPVLYMGGSIYILCVTLFFFTSFLDYWLDVWVVTNERIISIEQKGVFARVFSEQKLYRLQDISSNIEGFLPTVFHYGDVVAQSAGTEQNAVLKQVPGADIVARRIMDLMENSKRQHQSAE